MPGWRPGVNNAKITNQQAPFYNSAGLFTIVKETTYFPKTVKINKLQVTDLIAQDLLVKGTVTFDASVNIVGDVSIGGFVIVEGSSNLIGDVSMGGYLYVHNDVSFEAKLLVVGDVSFLGGLSVNDDVSFGDGLWIAGDVSMISSLSVGQTLTVHNTATFKEHVEMESTLHVVGDASFVSDVSIGGTLNVSGDVTLVDVSVTNLSVSGGLYGGSALDIMSDVSMHHGLSVVGESSFNNAVTMHNTLNVNGQAIFLTDVSVNQKLNVGAHTTLVDTSTGNLTVTGGAYFTSDVSIHGVCYVDALASDVGAGKPINLENSYPVEGSILNSTSLVTKAYVDQFVEGIKIHEEVDYATVPYIQDGSGALLACGNIAANPGGMQFISMQGRIQYPAASGNPNKYLLYIPNYIPNATGTGAETSLIIDGHVLSALDIPTLSDIDNFTAHRFMIKDQSGGTIAADQEGQNANGVYWLDDISMDGSDPNTITGAGIYFRRVADFDSSLTILAGTHFYCVSGIVNRDAAFLTMEPNHLDISNFVLDASDIRFAQYSKNYDISAGLNIKFTINPDGHTEVISVKEKLTDISTIAFGGTDYTASGISYETYGLSIQTSLGRAQFAQDVSISGGLTVADATNLNTTLTVVGKSTLADVSVNNNLSVVGDVSVNGTLGVGGQATFWADVSVGGNVIVGDIPSGLGDLFVVGDVSVNGGLSVDGDASFGSIVYSNVLCAHPEGYQPPAGEWWPGYGFEGSGHLLITSMDVCGIIMIGPSFEKVNTYGGLVPMDVDYWQWDEDIMNMPWTEYLNDYSGLILHSQRISVKHHLDVCGATILGHGANGALLVIGDASFVGDVSIAGILNVYGDSSFVGHSTLVDVSVTNLSVSGSIYGGSPLNIMSDVCMNEDLTVSGNVACDSLQVVGVAAATVVECIEVVAEIGGFDAVDITVSEVNLGTLRVGGDVSFNSTLNVIGDTSLSDVSINGGLWVVNDVSIGGDVSMYGTVYGGTWVHQSTVILGTLQVEGDASFNSDVSFTNPAAQIWMEGELSANKIVCNNPTICNISAINISCESMSVSRFVYLNEDPFVINHHLTVEKGFYVEGDASFNLDVSINRNLAVNGDVSFGGYTTLVDVCANDVSVNNLSVAGNIYGASPLQIASDVSINSGLTVTGDVTLLDTLTITGNQTAFYSHVNRVYFDGGSNTDSSFIVDTSNTTFMQDVSFMSDVSIVGGLYVDGHKLNAGGPLVSLNVTGDASFGGDVSINGALHVYGDASFVSDVSIGQKLYVAGDTTFMQDVSFMADASFVGDVSMSGTLYVAGDVTLYSNLGVDGNVTAYDVFADYVECASGGFTTSQINSGTLNVIGDASFVGDVSMGGTLYVAGESSFNDVSVNNLNVYGESSFNDVSVNNLNVYGESSFNDVSVNNLNVYGETSFNNIVFLNDPKSVTFTDPVGTTGALQMMGGAGIAKELFVGKDVSFGDTLHVKETATFYGSVYADSTLHVKTTTTTQGTVDISSATEATMAHAAGTKGALQVKGGAGIAKNLIVGGDVSFGNTLDVAGDVTVANLSVQGNLAGTIYELAIDLVTATPPQTIHSVDASGSFLTDVQGDGVLVAGQLLNLTDVKKGSIIIVRETGGGGDIKLQINAGPTETLFHTLASSTTTTFLVKSAGGTHGEIIVISTA